MQHSPSWEANNSYIELVETSTVHGTQSFITVFTTDRLQSQS
jgi:hypothetical protein